MYVIDDYEWHSTHSVGTHSRFVSILDDRTGKFFQSTGVMVLSDDMWYCISDGWDDATQSLRSSYSDQDGIPVTAFVIQY